MDQICPPSTVFAAFNNWANADRQISVYPYNGHEGGGTYVLDERGTEDEPVLVYVYET